MLLYGPPGTGKTSLIEAAYEEDLLTVQGESDTTVANFVAENTQNSDGTFIFVHEAEQGSLQLSGRKLTAQLNHAGRGGSVGR
ncbi:hypothetical protein NWFMUON74_39510 [Nocardia wallacei]|uniref:ATPase AAA-type core domain-containing protein n=1 Tax=Nocardia wallacei TaxID=480035 RepID=A0A7G1KQM1_9NOCA|nr:AAA family ATPase [Nocardia wallacei]BCK56179.1 hypothetical protein NWFMUON74_39510 [Nocardia wallacei]